MYAERLLGILEEAEKKNLATTKNFKAMETLAGEIYKKCTESMNEAKYLASCVKFDLPEDMDNNVYHKLVKAFVKLCCQVYLTLEFNGYPKESIVYTFQQMSLELQ